MIWCCPIHHGDLTAHLTVLRAECCGREFPLVEGIPDLRVTGLAWLNFAEDLQAARMLAAKVPASDVAGSIRAVFVRRRRWTAERIAQRTAMTLAIAAKMRGEWHGWLSEAGSHPGPMLDLGCGAGSLLSTAPNGSERIGVDVSMEWLIVAQRMCAAADVPVQLAAALAESLPLRDGSIGALTALDVIEHVGDQAAMVREIDRVLQPGGIFCAATPNRFSIGAEPHVGLWGVGWLPRSIQARYVHWRTTLPYDFTRLLSHREITALFQRSASFVPQIEPAPIPDTDLQHFGVRRRILASSYNVLLTLPPFRSIARNVGAFFHLRGVKPTIAHELMFAVLIVELLLPELLAFA